MKWLKLWLTAVMAALCVSHASATTYSIQGEHLLVTIEDTHNLFDSITTSTSISYGDTFNFGEWVAFYPSVTEAIGVRFQGLHDEYIDPDKLNTIVTPEPGWTVFGGGIFNDWYGLYHGSFIAVKEADWLNPSNWVHAYRTPPGSQYVPSVPEPSTYAMMGLSLGFIGLQAWRRRNTKV